MRKWAVVTSLADCYKGVKTSHVTTLLVSHSVTWHHCDMSHSVTQRHNPGHGTGHHQLTLDQSEDRMGSGWPIGGRGYISPCHNQDMTNSDLLILLRWWNLPRPVPRQDLSRSNISSGLHLRRVSGSGCRCSSWGYECCSGSHRVASAAIFTLIFAQLSSLN